MGAVAEAILIYWVGACLLVLIWQLCVVPAFALRSLGTSAETGPVRYGPDYFEPLAELHGLSDRVGELTRAGYVPVGAAKLDEPNLLTVTLYLADGCCLVEVACRRPRGAGASAVTVSVGSWEFSGGQYRSMVTTTDLANVVLFRIGYRQVLSVAGGSDIEVLTAHHHRRNVEAFGTSVFATPADAIEEVLATDLRIRSALPSTAWFRRVDDQIKPTYLGAVRFGWVGTWPGAAILRLRARRRLRRLVRASVAHAI